MTDDASRRELDAALHELHAAADDIQSDRVHAGDVDAARHARLEEQVMAMRRRLLPHIERAGLTHDWRQSQLDQIPVRCAQQIKRHETHVDKFGTTQEKDDLIRRAPVAQLLRWTDAMTKLYSKLESTADADSRQRTSRPGEIP